MSQRHRVATERMTPYNGAIDGHSATQWPQMGITCTMSQRRPWLTIGIAPLNIKAPPSGHNGNYTHNVTAPPSGHYKNYTPTRNVTAPPSGDSENYSPQY